MRRDSSPPISRDGEEYIAAKFAAMRQRYSHSQADERAREIPHIRKPTLLREQKGGEKSACSVRNDAAGRDRAKKR